MFTLLQQSLINKGSFTPTNDLDKATHFDDGKEIFKLNPSEKKQFQSKVLANKMSAGVTNKGKLVTQHTITHYEPTDNEEPLPAPTILSDEGEPETNPGDDEDGLGLPQMEFVNENV